MVLFTLHIFNDNNGSNDDNDDADILITFDVFNPLGFNNTVFVFLYNSEDDHFHIHLCLFASNT